MEQIKLLSKIDPKRLKDKPFNNSDYYNHECEHCKKLLTFPQKVKGQLKSKPVSGVGAYHAAHVARHPENNCNESGRASIEQRMIERKNKKQNMKKRSLQRRSNIKRKLLVPM